MPGHGEVWLEFDRGLIPAVAIVLSPSVPPVGMPRECVAPGSVLITVGVQKSRNPRSREDFGSWLAPICRLLLNRRCDVRAVHDCGRSMRSFYLVRWAAMALWRAARALYITIDNRFNRGKWPANLNQYLSAPSLLRPHDRRNVVGGIFPQKLPQDRKPLLQAGRSSPLPDPVGGSRDRADQLSPDPSFRTRTSAECCRTGAGQWDRVCCRKDRDRN